MNASAFTFARDHIAAQTGTKARIETGTEAKCFVRVRVEQDPVGCFKARLPICVQRRSPIESRESSNEHLQASAGGRD